MSETDISTVDLSRSDLPTMSPHSRYSESEMANLPTITHQTNRGVEYPEVLPCPVTHQGHDPHPHAIDHRHHQAHTGYDTRPVQYYVPYNHVFQHYQTGNYYQSNFTGEHLQAQVSYAHNEQPHAPGHSHQLHYLPQTHQPAHAHHHTHGYPTGGQPGLGIMPHMPHACQLQNVQMPIEGNQKHPQVIVCPSCGCQANTLVKKTPLVAVILLMFLFSGFMGLIIGLILYRIGILAHYNHHCDRCQALVSKPKKLC